MGEFIIHIIIKLAILGAGTMIFGIGLMPVFKKTEKAVWKAFVPIYNLYTWIRLTKNPGWLLLLLLQFYWLPEMYIRVVSIGVLAWLVGSTYGLFYKRVNKVGFAVLAFIAVFAILYIFDTEFGDYQNYFIYGAAIVSAILLFMLGSGPKAFDKQKYYSNEFTFSRYASRQFKKNKMAYISQFVLGFLALLAMYAPYIATDQPYMVEVNGKTYFPAYQVIEDNTVGDTIVDQTTGTKTYLQFDIANWKAMRVDKVIWAPITYNNKQTDQLNPDVGPSGEQLFKTVDGEYVPMPGKFRHVMGTNPNGLDVASGIIHGTRISLTIGFIAMGIATLIGILLGALQDITETAACRPVVSNIGLFFLQ